MLTIDAKAMVDDVVKALNVAESQLQFALAKAITATAQQVREAERNEMRKVFVNPTPFTLNSLYLRSATKARLQAEVWLKWGSQPEHYLLPQIQGGARPLKRFEQRMVMNGLMGPGQRAVPAAGAKLNAYGNMSKGQIVQILSQLRTDVVSGVSQNATNSKRSRAKRSRVAYFVSRGTGSAKGRGAGARRATVQNLPAGVWARYTFSWGSAVKPVLLFVNGTRYSRRFDFFKVADATVSRAFPGAFEAAARDAMRTARLSQQGGLF